MRSRFSPFPVQVTELVDGLFIGSTANRTVLDDSSFWDFFNTWSNISRNSGFSISQRVRLQS